MAKWYKIAVNKATGNIDVNIFDEIGGWGYSASDFLRDLEGAGKGKITLRINSPGGDVFAGFAIANTIARIKDRVTAVVEGLAASMGSVIAVSAGSLVMPENSMLMIHDPAGMAAGGPEEMASFADALDKMRDQIVAAYVAKTKLSETKIRDMMSKETWLSAAEAVKMGFADQIEKPIQMAAHAGFDLKCYQNVPQSFGTATLVNKEDTQMKRDAIKSLVALSGVKNVALGDTIPEDKTVAEVVALIETAKTEEAAAAAAAARAAEGKPPSADEIRNQVLGEISEINSLCALAGMADKAPGFVAAKKSVKEVIAALAEAKAAMETAEASKRKGKKADASGTEVNARHNPNPHAEGSEAVALDTTAVWDKFNKRK